MAAAEAAPEKIILRDPDGNVTEEAFMKNGELEGETLLYSAGRVIARLAFRGGKQSGLSTYYTESGQVSMKVNYADGKADGESEYFDQKGKLLRRALFAKGLLEGRTIDFYPSGKARIVSHYHANILHGEVWEYSEDGKLQERRCYKEGKQVACPQSHAAPPAQRRS